MNRLPLPCALLMPAEYLSKGLKIPILHLPSV